MLGTYILAFVPSYMWQRSDSQFPIALWKRNESTKLRSRCAPTLIVYPLKIPRAHVLKLCISAKATNRYAHRHVTFNTQHTKDTHIGLCVSLPPWSRQRIRPQFSFINLCFWNMLPLPAYISSPAGSSTSIEISNLAWSWRQSPHTI